MTLTNTSGDPMTVAGVVAVGDYTASSHCVLASPLDADATCTVTVTFTPTEAGSRQGALQIIELAETFGFRLTGMGPGGPDGRHNGVTPAPGQSAPPNRDGNRRGARGAKNFS